MWILVLKYVVSNQSWIFSKVLLKSASNLTLCKRSKKKIECTITADCHYLALCNVDDFAVKGDTLFEVNCSIHWFHIFVLARMWCLFRLNLLFLNRLFHSKWFNAFAVAQRIILKLIWTIKQIHRNDLIEQTNSLNSHKKVTWQLKRHCGDTTYWKLK